jgi:hypothetical protein
MTEDQKYEIALLAEDYEAKRLRHENLGYVNTSGKTAEELEKLNIDYHIADAEKLEAWGRLTAAKAKLMGLRT